MEMEPSESAQESTKLLRGPKLKQPNSYVYKLTLAASINSLCLGYDVGVMGAAGLQLEDSIPLNTFELESIMAAFNIAAIFGAASSYQVADRFGRTKAILISSWTILVGRLSMALVSSYPLLLIARLVTGFGGGLGFAIDPLYITEISPAAYRGFLVTFSEIGINIGIFAGFAGGLIFMDFDDGVGWRYMFILGCVFPLIVMYISYFVLPETPRWFVKNGRTNEARSILQEIADPEEVDKILVDISSSLEEENAIIYTDEESLKVVRMMVFVVVFIATFQQLSGVDGVLYYTHKMMDDKDIAGNKGISLFMMFVVFIKGITLIASGYWMDKESFGRRNLLLLSYAGCLLSLVFMAIAAFLNEFTAVLILLIPYFLFFSLGMGPVSWVLPSEILPLSIRAKGVSFAGSMNRIASTLVSLTFLSLSHVFDYGGVFLINAMFMAFAFIVVYNMLPETRQKTLEEMFEHFSIFLLGYRVEPPDKTTLKGTSAKTVSGEEMP